MVDIIADFYRLKQYFLYLDLRYFLKSLNDFRRYLIFLPETVEFTTNIVLIF